MKIIGKIPHSHFHVACSGGSDSMVLVDFLLKFKNNKFDIIHFNHGTECCEEAEKFVENFCKEHSIELHIGKIQRDREKNESKEEYWRKCRYDFFSKFSDEPILLAHHLNDCIETWIMTAAQGNPRLIPYHNPNYNIFRPMLAVSKKQIENWAERHGVKYVTDRSNFDTAMNRNYTRHVIMEHLYHLNPGIEKTIAKKIISKFDERIKRGQLEDSHSY